MRFCRNHVTMCGWSRHLIVINVFVCAPRDVNENGKTDDARQPAVIKKNSEIITICPLVLGTFTWAPPLSLLQYYYINHSEPGALCNITLNRINIYHSINTVTFIYNIYFNFFIFEEFVMFKWNYNIVSLCHNIILIRGYWLTDV